MASSAKQLRFDWTQTPSFGPEDVHVSLPLEDELFQSCVEEQQAVTIPVHTGMEANMDGAGRGEANDSPVAFSPELLQDVNDSPKCDSLKSTEKAC